MSKVCEKKRDHEALSVAFAFAHGDIVTVQVEELPENIRHRLAVEGIAHALGDSYSGCKGDSATALEMLTKKLDAWKAGEWSAGRESTGGMWVEALAEHESLPVEDALAAWNGLDDDGKKALRAVPSLKAIHKRLEAERAEKAAERASGQDGPSVADLIG